MKHFVYIWFDTLRKMFYIGSHSGYEEDQYISSSRWLRGEILYRPQDFRRRIVSLHDTKELARKEEYRLIGFIKRHEFGTRYYNLKTGRREGSPPAHNKGKPMSLELRINLSKQRKGKPALNKGKKYPDRTGSNNVMNRPENRDKMKKIATGRRMGRREDGTRYWIYPEGTD